MEVTEACDNVTVDSMSCVGMSYHRKAHYYRAKHGPWLSSGQRPTGLLYTFTEPHAGELKQSNMRNRNNFIHFNSNL